MKEAYPTAALQASIRGREGLHTDTKGTPKPTAPLAPSLPDAVVILSCCNSNVTLPLLRGESYLALQTRIHKELIRQLKFATHEISPCFVHEELLKIELARGLDLGPKSDTELEQKLLKQSSHEQGVFLALPAQLESTEDQHEAVSHPDPEASTTCDLETGSSSAREIAGEVAGEVAEVAEVEQETQGEEQPLLPGLWLETPQQFDKWLSHITGESEAVVLIQQQRETGAHIMRRENKILKDAITPLRDENKRLALEIKTLEARIQNLKAETAGLREEITKLKAEPKSTPSYGIPFELGSEVIAQFTSGFWIGKITKKESDKIQVTYNDGDICNYPYPPPGFPIIGVIKKSHSLGNYHKLQPVTQGQRKS